MVFVEFTTAGGDKVYFVGTSLQAILDDTKGGTEFGFMSLSGRREVTEEDLRKMRFEYRDTGIHAVKEGLAESYFIGKPLIPRRAQHRQARSS